MVTDIVHTGECGNEIFKNFRQLSSKGKNLINKSKIVPDDDTNNHNEQNEGGDGNSNENEVDDDYYMSNSSLINL